MAPGEAPAIRRRLLGRQLARLRTKAGFSSIDEAAEKLDKSRSAAYRQETGDTAVSRPDLMAYLKLYGVNEGTPEAENLYALLPGVRGGSWWGKFKDVASQPQADIADLEDMASILRYYDPFPITGIVQCDSYIEGLFAPEKERLLEMGLDVAKQIDFRRQRRENVLTRENKPKVQIVFSEAALRNWVGGPDIMREQCSYMADLIDQGLDLRIIPLTNPFVSGMNRPKIIATIGGSEPSDVVYLEDAPIGKLIDDEVAAAKFVRRFGLLQKNALAPEQSAALLRDYEA